TRMERRWSITDGKTRQTRQAPHEQPCRLSGQLRCPRAQSSKGNINRALVTGELDFGLQAQRERSGLRADDQCLRGFRICDIDEYRAALGIRQQFVQEPDPFRSDGRVHRADAGDVAAWSIEAAAKASLARIG